MVFVMRPERVEELLLSYRYHESKLKEKGYELAGIVPRYFSELDRLLKDYKKKNPS
jgi:hypothetical protein